MVSCSSNELAPDHTAVSTPPPPAASATPATPTPSPTPALPVPADGKNPRSCADGTCEIRVSGPMTVPLPARFGLGSIEVTAIKAHTVTMVVRLTQSEFSSDGGCSAFITGPAANADAHVDLTCHAADKAVVNGMNLQVVGIAHKAAVIRIRPAT